MKNIKITKIAKYICGPEELIACPCGTECVPAVWDPTCIVLFQPQTTWKQMLQSRAHVWQSRVARDSTPGSTRCTAGRWAVGHGNPGVCSLSQGTLPFRWPCKQKATTLPSWRLTWQNHHHHETITYFQVPVLAIWMPVKKAINQEYRAKPLKWCLKRKFIFKHRTQTKNWVPFFPKIQHFWGFFDKTVQL